MALKQTVERIQAEEDTLETILGSVTYDGDLADLYARHLDHPRGPKAIFKVARRVFENDLLETEAAVLTKLFPATQKEEKFWRYLPRCLESFKTEKSKRQVNVIEWYDEFLSFEEIIRAYPMGIDFRDVTWMFKRLLAGIGFPHTQSIIHGALLPPHVLVHPTGHGAKIIDWAYAVDLKATLPPLTMWERLDEDDDGKPTPRYHHVKAISKLYEDYYAPEILKKELPTPAADIYMVAKCAVALLGGDVKTNQMPDAVPREIQEFLDPMLRADPARRPQDAWKLHEEYDLLLRRVVGKPVYRPFAMPAKTA